MGQVTNVAFRFRTTLMCLLDLALEIQQKGTQCTMVIALSAALSFVGEV